MTKKPPKPKKIMIAIPTYNGDITMQTMQSAMEEIHLLNSTNYSTGLVILPGSSQIHLARDVLADKFIKGQYDKLVFIDADVSWQRGSIKRLVEHNVDFVGGAYRVKQDAERYPVTFPERMASVDPGTGLVECSTLPGGFLCLTQAVFQKMKDAKLGHMYGPPGLGEQVYSFWWSPRGDGEDAAFCYDWRRIGGKVWLDPNLTLTHTGGKPSFTGNFAEWITRVSSEAQP